MRFVAILKLKSLGCSDSLFIQALWHRASVPILATDHYKPIGGCEGLSQGLFRRIAITHIYYFVHTEKWSNVVV